MNKRGMLALLLALALAAMTALVACGGQSETQSKESFDISAEPEEEPVVLKTEPFYVLVVGDDTRKGTVGLHGMYANGKGRSDTCMLVRVDPVKYTFDLITIPRDTEASYDGETIKFNESYERGGIDGLKTAVKDLTGVSVDYYIVTTFVGFQDIIDALGGLHIVVPIDESMNDVVSGDLVEFPAGESDLNGKEALVFARDRHSYDYTGNGETYRQVNDRYIMQTIMKAIMALGADKASDMAGKLYAHVDSDLTDRELSAYVAEFAEHADGVAFTSSCTGPYDGGIDEATGKWLAWRDEEAWASLIDAVEAGDDPNEVVPIPVIDYDAAVASDEGEGEY